MRTYGHHLKKAASDRKGYLGYREKEVQSVLADPEPMNNFPAHLNLRDQGLFAIGYYHKRKDLWTSSKPESDATPDQES
jgi:CRISPR-associated protein Csd1